VYCVYLSCTLQNYDVLGSSTCQQQTFLAAARDTRREGMLVGGTNKKKTVRYELDVTARDDTVSSDAICKLQSQSIKCK